MDFVCIYGYTVEEGGALVTRHASYTCLPSEWRAALGGEPLPGRTETKRTRDDDKEEEFWFRFGPEYIPLSGDLRSRPAMMAGPSLQ